jgi:hypothetical protein
LEPVATAVGPVALLSAAELMAPEASPIVQQSPAEFYHALMSAGQPSEAVHARAVESLLGIAPRGANGVIGASLAPGGSIGGPLTAAIEGATVDPAMLSNMAETGFASLPMTPESVMLPTSGAGRAGSTASAVARAKQAVGPARLKAMAQAELAARGGTTPEAQMAAMEQVARRVASGY